MKFMIPGKQLRQGVIETLLELKTKPNQQTNKNHPYTFIGNICSVPQ